MPKPMKGCQSSDHLVSFFNKADFILFRSFLVFSCLDAVLRINFGCSLIELLRYCFKR
jgi:hypothetical protein